MSAALAPFDATLVIDRLRAQAPSLRDIGGSVEALQAFTKPGALPAAYVMLTEEIIDTRRFTEMHEHAATAIVAVIIGVRNYRIQERGQVHMDAMLPIVGEVRAALYGWLPTMPTGVRAETMRGHGRSRVEQFDNAVLWWRENFSIEYRSRIR